MHLSTPIARLHIAGCTFLLSLLVLLGVPPAQAADEPVHGLWVWKGPAIVAEAGQAVALRDFCSSQGINEVYISVTTEGVPQLQRRFAQLIALLHRAHVRVEALLSSENADEPGKHRLKLLEQVQAVIQFNQQHDREERFDGIHLDIEPQQRAENKGADNFRFLPDLLETYRAVRALAAPNGLMVDADIQRKLLEASVDQRRMLLSSLPRFTLMLYGLDRPADGDTTALRSEKLRNTSGKLFDAAYDGLHDPHLAKLIIGLRTPDYGRLMPTMLATLDQAYQAQIRVGPGIHTAMLGPEQIGAGASRRGLHERSGPRMTEKGAKPAKNLRMRLNNSYRAPLSH